MANYVLKILETATTYTYSSNDALVKDNYAVQSEIKNGVIGQSSITIRISGSFLNQTDIFLLPADSGDGWRAELTLGAMTILNGIVYRSGVRYDPFFEMWTITVVDAAAEQFLKRLDALSLIEPAFLVVDINVKIVPDDEVPILRMIRWHSIEALWHALINAQADLAWTHYPWTDGDWFYLDVDYLDAGSNPQTENRKRHLYITQISETGELPNWTGRRLYECIALMLGFRLRASFQAWPSTNIDAFSATDRWDAISTAPGLDGLVLKDGYDIGFTPAEYGDFALMYQNPSQDTLFEGSRPANPAVYAADYPNQDEKGDGKNDNVVKIPLSVPAYDTSTTTVYTNGDYSETVISGRPVLRIGSESDEDQPVFVGAFEHGKLIVQRIILSPLQAHQVSLVCEYWAYNLFKHYQITRSPRYRLEGSFDIASRTARFIVGDPQNAQLLLSKPWMIQKSSEDFGNGKAGLSLIYPEVLAQSLPTIPNIGPVENLSNTGAVQTSLNVYSVDLNWEAPLIGVPTEYEIYRKGFDAGMVPDDDFTLVATVNSAITTLNQTFFSLEGQWTWRVYAKNIIGSSEKKTTSVYINFQA